MQTEDLIYAILNPWLKLSHIFYPLHLHQSSGQKKKFHAVICIRIQINICQRLTPKMENALSWGEFNNTGTRKLKHVFFPSVSLITPTPLYLSRLFKFHATAQKIVWIRKQWQKKHKKEADDTSLSPFHIHVIDNTKDRTKAGG